MKTLSLRSVPGISALLTILFAISWPTVSSAVFSDVTNTAGLSSTTQSRGAAWGDYDGDNCVDLYVSAAGGGTLYKNNCDGTFADVTAAAGITGDNGGWGAAWADYDGDNDLDLYVGSASTNPLLRNNGDGTFTNVAAAAGVADDRGTAGVSWADYDADGDLDLFIVNRFSAGNRAEALYQNQGNGTFVDVAVAAGVAGDIDRRSFMGVWFDYDNDGDIDLYLSVDFGDDVLYSNNGNGSFNDVSLAAGITDPQHGMGVTVGDINNDGCLDVLSTNNTQGLPDDAEHNSSALYLNNCNGTFSRVSESAGILDRAVVEWGANFIDYDNDTDLDLSIVAGGMLTGGEPNILYENSGSCTSNFFDITVPAGVGNQGATFGSAWADYDGDGDLDWFIVNEIGSNVLFRNDGASGNHLKVRLFGAGANTRGIGALVKMTSGGVVQSRVVQAGTSYSSAEESHAFFGLGVKNTADRVTVLWPAGTQSELTNVSAGSITISESGAPPPPPPPPPPPGTDATVSGTTFNPSGIAEPDVQVRLRDQFTGQEIIDTFSDASGQYSLTAPGDTYEIQARKVGTGWGNIRLNVTLADGETLIQDLMFGGSPPPPADATVTGTTFNPSGIAEPDVQVRLWIPLTKEEVVNTFTDAAGQFSLTAPAGVYKLQARKSGSGWGNVSIDATLTAGEPLIQDMYFSP